MAELFDNLFPLIVMYIIWRIFSKAKDSVSDESASTDSGQGQNAGKKKKVTVGLAEVLRQIMGGELDMPQQGKAVGKQQTFAHEEEPMPGKWQSPWMYEEQEYFDSVIDSRQVVHEEVLPAYEMPEPVEKQKVEPASAPGLDNLQSRKRKKFALAGAKRQRLREAVIWSEVLGRPVALRGEE